MAAFERRGQAAEAGEINSIETARQAVILRYGADAVFLYRTPDGTIMIMTIDQAFEISGSHILAELTSDSRERVDATWKKLDALKNGADDYKDESLVAYQKLVDVGEKYLESWRERPTAS